MPVADDTWVDFTIHPGHIPDQAFMTIASTDYSSAIPRGLVLRTAKPGTRFGQTMTEKAQVVVSLGAEPMGRGGDDATEEPEKVWDLGPGEYVVNRGTRLDKTRMYECQGSGSDRRGSPAPGRWTVSKALFFTASNATLATFSEM